MPDDIPEKFEIGELLSAAALNRLQTLILERLAQHDHTGGAKANPITTPGLSDKSVTGPKLADDAVTARALADGAVTEAALGNEAVTAGKLADDAVTTEKIKDDSATLDKLSPEVRALLLRVGDGASSFSQIIWRDPFITFPVDNGLTIIDAVKDPNIWKWPPRVVGVNDDNDPIRFNPVADPDKIIAVVDFDDPLTNPVRDLMNDAAIDTAIGLIGVGAAGVATGTLTGGDLVMTGGTFDGGSFGGLTMRGSPTMGGVFMGSPAPAGAMSAPQPEMASFASAPAPQSAPQPTKTGKDAARRMMTISTTDENGAPVDAKDPNAIAVTSAFSGKDALSESGSAVDYRALDGANNNTLSKAAEDAGRILFNLGFDMDYAAAAKLVADDSKAFELAYNGDRDFFDAPLWQDKSWLPDILNRPELFGSGYAISGGRNILSVTRHFQKGQLTNHWLRVRFVTPYRNASYAVTCTPRGVSGYDMVTPQIITKTTTYCDLRFTGLKRANSGTVSIQSLSKLGFDLAVFGQLGAPK